MNIILTMLGHGRSQLDDRFWLAIEYTPLHRHPRLTPRMDIPYSSSADAADGYFSGVYSIDSQNSSSNYDMEQSV